MISESFIKRVEKSNLISNLKFFYNGLKIKKYVLQKEPINVSYEVKTTPLIRKNSYSLERNNVSNQEYEELIDEFIEIMTSKFLRQNYKIMCRNIKNISFKEKKMFILQGGKYCIGDNCITFNSHLKKISDNKKEIRKQIIMHELLHMSTTIIHKEHAFSGFFQASKKSLHYSIGKGINEGYTELLNQRHFCKKSLLDSYSYQVEVSKLVEMIVGEEKMTNLYFAANLNGLIKELSQYSSISQVKTFIINLDKITKFQKPRIILPSEKRFYYANSQICDFLLSAYANKLLIDVSQGIISKEQSHQKITEYYRKMRDFYNMIKLGNVFYPQKNTALRKKHQFF